MTVVSIVLSFRNEAAVIPELIDRLTRTLTPLAIEYELVRNVCASEVEMWMHQQMLHIFESPGTKVVDRKHSVAQ